MNPQTSRELFGFPVIVDAYEARVLWSDLTAVWQGQTQNWQISAQLASSTNMSSLSQLDADLGAMKVWFDPVASGKRLRELFAVLPATSGSDSRLAGELLIQVGSDQWLVTPEGRAIMWAVEHVGINTAVQDQFFLPDNVVRSALAAVHRVYRTWVLQRVSNVAGLLAGETATLRPSAAGLLFVLLVNRNTSRPWRLPSPSNPALSAEVSRTIAAPALAFARELSGTEKANERGFDLYRGWAMGEIARRLGTGLHKDGEGIWIDPEAEGAARARLIEALADRPPSIRERVPAAIQSALAEYERVRPVLASLGVAHERPSSTRRLVDEILRGLSLGEESRSS